MTFSPACTTVAVCRRVAALLLSLTYCPLDVVTLRPLLPGRGWLSWTGREEPDAVVVPAGGGLVPSSPQRPAQREGEPGAGDEPGGVSRGEAGEPGGLGDR